MEDFILTCAWCKNWTYPKIYSLLNCSILNLQQQRNNPAVVTNISDEYYLFNILRNLGIISLSAIANIIQIMVLLLMSRPNICSRKRSYKKIFAIQLQNKYLVTLQFTKPLENSFHEKWKPYDKFIRAEQIFGTDNNVLHWQNVS